MQNLGFASMWQPPRGWPSRRHGHVWHLPTLALLDMHPGARDGVDIVVTYPGQGKIIALQTNTRGVAWVQMSISQDADGVTELADIDGDGRNDVIATTESALLYWLTCGGGCGGDGHLVGPAGRGLVRGPARKTARRTARRELLERGHGHVPAVGDGPASGAEGACTVAGCTWDWRPRCAPARRRRPRATKRGRSTAAPRGWSPPTRLAVANAAGDGGVDLVFGSDSSATVLEDGTVAPRSATSGTHRHLPRRPQRGGHAPPAAAEGLALHPAPGLPARGDPPRRRRPLLLATPRTVRLASSGVPAGHGFPCPSTRDALPPASAGRRARPPPPPPPPPPRPIAR